MPATPSLRPVDARFLLILVLPGLALLGVLVNPAYAAVNTLAIWLLFAAIDAFWPGAQHSPVARTEPQPLLQGLLRLYAPLQAALIVIAALVAAHSGWPTVCGLALSVGFVTGAQGITLAHELGHSRSRLDRTLAWLLMASVGYGHFMVEHYRGHHPRAATFEDPATARRDESLWRFLPRTLWGSWVNAWRLEASQLDRLDRSWLRSPLAWSVALNAALSASLLALGQYKALVFWILQAAFAVWLLETVNYIEHYGLQRKEAAGQREVFGLMHAWNADHVASNSLLANLQRHSDHHMHAWKPWPTLEALPGPQLPTGYSGCIFLAALPPLWFSLMHPRLAALEDSRLLQKS